MIVQQSGDRSLRVNPSVVDKHVACLKVLAEQEAAHVVHGGRRTILHGVCLFVFFFFSLLLLGLEEV